MQNYYFTFGIGTELGDKYHVIQAETGQQAVDKMNCLYMRDWAFMYTEKEWEEEWERSLEKLDLQKESN